MYSGRLDEGVAGISNREQSSYSASSPISERSGTALQLAWLVDENEEKTMLGKALERSSLACMPKDGARRKDERVSTRG